MARRKGLTGFQRWALERLEPEGWEVRRMTKKRHAMLGHPTGATACLPGTPSDWRSGANVVSQARADVRARRAGAA